MSAMNIDGNSVYADVKGPQLSILSYSDLMNLDDDDDGTLAAPTATGPTGPEVTLPSNDDVCVPSVQQQQQKGTQNVSQSPSNNKPKYRKRNCHNRKSKEELNNRLRCPECETYRCWTEDRLTRHILRVHRGENEFQCNMCLYSTYNKAVFEEHVRVHNGIKPFKCCHCDYRSASKKNAKLHESRHRPCPDCDFFPKNVKALNLHRHQVHGVQIYGIKTDDGKRYTCDLCKTELLGSIEKRSHYVNRRKCSECTYVSCSRTMLYQHVKQEHGFKPVKKPTLFSCSLCLWGSSNMLRILLHLIHHPKQKVDENVIDITVLKKCGIM